MNENIDLTKILKNCPKGWEFYSSNYGVEPSAIYPTKEEALNSSHGVSYIDTVRIEWKE